MSAEVLLLVILAGAAWFWWDSLQKREIALNAAHRACHDAGVQLLDGSVALRRVRLRRDDMQRARVYREFSFDYSTAGDDRHPGRIYLLGAQVQATSLIQSASA